MIAKTIKTELALQSQYISDFSVTSVSLPPKMCSRNDSILVSCYFSQSGFISRSSEMLGQTRHALRCFLAPTICVLLCWWCTPIFLSNHPPALGSMNSEMNQCPNVKWTYNLSIFCTSHSPGYSDWLRDGHMKEPEPIGCRNILRLPEKETILYLNFCT